MSTATNPAAAAYQIASAAFDAYESAATAAYESAATAYQSAAESARQAGIAYSRARRDDTKAARWAEYMVATAAADDARPAMQSARESYYDRHNSDEYKRLRDARDAARAAADAEEAANAATARDAAAAEYAADYGTAALESYVYPDIPPATAIRAARIVAIADASCADPDAHSCRRAYIDYIQLAMLSESYRAAYPDDAGIIKWADDYRDAGRAAAAAEIAYIRANARRDAARDAASSLRWASYELARDNESARANIYQSIAESLPQTMPAK